MGGNDPINDRIRLPEGISIKNIWDKYALERPDPISISYFYKRFSKKAKEDRVSLQRHVGISASA